MPRRASTTLLGAAASGALLFLTWFTAFHVGVFEHADQSIYQGFVDLGQHGRLHALAERVAHLCDPSPYVYLAVVPIALALARGRPRLGLAVAVILLGSNLTTHLLKPLLAEPRPSSLFGGVDPIGAGSWPSGHATAAMSLALACVVVAPARLRPLAAAVGAAFAIAVSYSFLALGWHYPSDVLGGFLVAGSWTLLAVAAVSAADARKPRPEKPRTGRRLSVREAVAAPAAAMAGALVLAAPVALARPHEVASFAQGHQAFVAGAMGIAVLGLLLATGVMLALRK